jgi:hypothetical protein
MAIRDVESAWDGPVNLGRDGPHTVQVLNLAPNIRFGQNRQRFSGKGCIVGRYAYRSSRFL